MKDKKVGCIYLVSKENTAKAQIKIWILQKRRKYYYGEDLIIFH